MITSAPVIWFDQIDSTNEEARRRATQGQSGPLWIVARSQSGGRGRLGRHWASPQGNLFATALLPAPGGVQAALRVPFATALAVSDVCLGVLPDQDVRLKWPNDIRVRGAKLCGILVEAGQTNGAYWLAIGIGLNVRSTPEGTGQTVTCLLQEGAGPELQAEDLMEALRPALASRLKQAQLDFASTRQDWLGRAEGLGELVEAGPGGHRRQGRFVGLAEDGGLRLEYPDGQEEIIRAGEVELIKEVRADAPGH